ncbi:hypothetical protein CJ030_MR3G003310 [Morella rubra]|uniref:Uncharacterized protein n=1 Tax=Morella rubra TaxID=262757 RepID=A0A6A1WD83_9ROSI|nr:hypothetical protein CJ030_MR3G003310 [Morella rubra]
MRADRIFEVELLSEDEAWNLFREMAGKCIDNPNLGRIAKEVAEECGRLPVAVVTVGSALRDKTAEYEWNAALQQLKKSIPQNIPGLHPKVYKSIEFSYNYIQSNEARSCFLLCCLFPEDYHIPIEDLVRYGVGRRLFARNRCGGRSKRKSPLNRSVSQKIKSIVGQRKGEEYIRMHDIVRDVAISIASRDEHGFKVVFDNEIEEWPQKIHMKAMLPFLLDFENWTRIPTDWSAEDFSFCGFHMANIVPRSSRAICLVG